MILYHAFDVDYGWGYGENYCNVSNEEEYNELNLLQKFFLNNYNNASSYITGVGNVHFPFNATSDYNYSNTNNVNSNWTEWLNYPDVSTNTTAKNYDSWREADINHNILNDENEEHDNDRLYVRFWSSLFPHVTGYTADGYSNNWWTYISSYNFVKSLSSQNYTFNVDDKLSIEVVARMDSGDDEIINLSKYEKNMIFADKSLFKVDQNGDIYAAKSGTTTLKYYRDGKYVIISIRIN